MDMARAISQARGVARKAAEMLYEHTCTVLEYRTRRVQGESKQKPAVVYADIPCRLVFPAQSAAMVDGAGDLTYDALVILSPDYLIKPGSLFSVTHDGGVSKFKQSGDAVVFATHQEIKVTRVGRP